MGIPVMIMGQSGSGKSASLRNFDPTEVGVFNVASKPLPFRKQMMIMNGATYESITTELRNASLKRYVIDDSQYLMAFEFFGRAMEKGYDKFTEIGLRFYNLIQTILYYTPADCIVYLLQHVETAYDAMGNKQIKAKTIGKMLDEKLTVEGLFSIVLLCQSDSTGRHFFQTQAGGSSTAKSPIGMFPLEIDNDLNRVDKAIREYYGL